ncbi:MAG: peptidoglycan DD-metalloendopeptidase family protein [Patescibacteria group bacterium]
MNKKIVKLFFFLLFIGLFLNSSSFAFGQSNAQIDKEIQDLNSQIESQRKQLELIQKNQKEYSDLIKSKSEEKDSLQNQLDILDSRFKKAELETEEVKLEISKNNLEIKKIAIDIDNNSDKIDKDKNRIENLLKFLYKQNKTTPIEIVLLNNSITDFINQVQYLEDTNRELGDSLKSLKETKELLENQEKTLKEKETKLVSLKEELARKQMILEGELESKTFLLDQTKESEVEYKRLLALAKKEQDRASGEILSLEASVRERLAEKSKDEGTDINNFSDSGFSWPVTKNVITSTFHDPSYPFRRSIGEHSGIDIRSAQGNTLMAAASGYVARVKFDGTTAYSYIMIIHGDGYSTVYGHVSAVTVKEDQYVTQGQVIGRTGGAPRTVGAGAFSTGPHLHFEIRKDGIPINPLPLLP